MALWNQPIGPRTLDVLKATLPRGPRDGRGLAGLASSRPFARAVILANALAFDALLARTLPEANALIVSTRRSTRSVVCSPQLTPSP